MENSDVAKKYFSRENVDSFLGHIKEYNFYTQKIIPINILKVIIIFIKIFVNSMIP